MKFQKSNPVRLFYGLMFLAFTILGISACSKETNYERFSLTKFNGTIGMVHADTSVTFSWAEAFTAWEPGEELPAYSYEITIAKDADFRDVDAITVVQDSLTLTIGKERLTPMVEYYARVRVLGGANVSNSDWANYLSSGGERTFRVLSEINYFKPNKVGDLIDVAARLRWSTSKELVSRLVLTTSEDAAFRKVVELTDEESNAGIATVSGLASGTEYLAELYLVKGDGSAQRRGRQTFTTKPDVTGAGYVDLRSSSDPTILQTTLNTVPAGSIIVLKRGLTYTISSTVLLNRDVTIMSEPGFGAQALIQMTSSFGVAGDSQLNLLKFEDVEIKGTGSTYVFNLTLASVIQKLEFEACRISDHVGVVRLQSAGVKYLNDYVVNNSIIQNIGAQGVLQVDHADVIVNHINLTNSTFINAEWIIRYNSSVRTDLNSMVIESSTFFRAPYNNRFILDIARTGSTIGSFVANNTLFGFTTGGRSFNSRTPASISAMNSFATSDAVWGTSATQALTAAGIARYPATSEQVFVAPDKTNFSNSDLTIKEAALSTVGDPRWRP